MKKISGLLLGAYIWLQTLTVCAAEKFEILPDLPEPLAAAQASSISTTQSAAEPLTQTVGQEPNLLSVVCSLVFVILLIYATGIIYAKLNRAGFKTLKQIRELDDSRVSVISTTPLGNNKTLHVVELDGKRMLIGASNNSIDLIKDLGNYPPHEIEEGEFSNIEIPNIRIPKIEIPKIEFPNINFTKTTKNMKFDDLKNNSGNIKKENENKSDIKEDEDGFVITDIYEEGSDGIIDKLFTPSSPEKETEKEKEPSSQKSIHTVDPDEYALYKKYL